MFYKPKHGKTGASDSEPKPGEPDHSWLFQEPDEPADEEDDEPLDPSTAMLLEIIMNLGDAQLLVVKKLAVVEAQLDLVRASVALLARDVRHDGDPLETAPAFDGTDQE